MRVSDDELGDHPRGHRDRLLDRFGYKRGADGYRRMPDGKPLVVRYARAAAASSTASTTSCGSKSMDAIGIRMEFDTAPFAENLKAAKACKLMMWESAWGADYPDGDNFMQLLYGPNTGQSNNGCYESKAFDAFYEKSRELPDSPERNRLFLEMSRQMEVDGAWSLHLSRERKLADPAVGAGLQDAIRSCTPSGMYMDIRAVSRIQRHRGRTCAAFVAALLRARSRWRARSRRRPPTRTRCSATCSRSAETGFDPAAMHDLYSAGIVRAIFETLYTYDYLARPAKLVPQAADGMPQITDDGKDVHGQARRRASTSRPIRRSAARSASSPPTTSSTRTSASPIRRSARRMRSWSRASSSGLDDEIAAREEIRASSTTTRRFPASRPSTATRCASA